MIKVYLDTCALQRPLDTKNQLRIALESEAVLGLLSIWESGQIELIFSDAHTIEMERNTNLSRKEYAMEVISCANAYITLTTAVANRAKALNKMGVKPLDALHLAFAESANVDFFCTCDDELLKKSKSIKGLKICIISPLDLIKELDK